MLLARAEFRRGEDEPGDQSSDNVGLVRASRMIDISERGLVGESPVFLTSSH